jgi:cell division cycle protein 37
MELEAFRGRIRRRAEEKLAEAMEEERLARLGPGGLDPYDVIETLPEELKECFENQDIPKLKEIIAKMDLKDAAYHMKRCVDSGLWVPNANDSFESPAEEDLEQSQAENLDSAEKAVEASKTVEEESG